METPINKFIQKQNMSKRQKNCRYRYRSRSRVKATLGINSFFNLNNTFGSKQVNAIYFGNFNQKLSEEQYLRDIENKKNYLNVYVKVFNDMKAFGSIRLKSPRKLRLIAHHFSINTRDIPNSTIYHELFKLNDSKSPQPMSRISLLSPCRTNTVKDTSMVKELDLPSISKIDSLNCSEKKSDEKLIYSRKLKVLKRNRISRQLDSVLLKNRDFVRYCSADFSSVKNNKQSRKRNNSNKVAKKTNKEMKCDVILRLLQDLRNDK